MKEQKLKESVIKAQIENRTCGKLVEDCMYCPFFHKKKNTCNLIYAGAVYLAMLGNVEIEGAKDERSN